jgi:hypothetical protein
MLWSNAHIFVILRGCAERTSVLIFGRKTNRLPQKIPEPRRRPAKAGAFRVGSPATRRAQQDRENPERFRLPIIDAGLLRCSNDTLRRMELHNE